MKSLQPFLMLLLGALLLALAGAAHAHFQILVPSRDIVEPSDPEIDLTVIFSHPMEGGPVMEMGTPVQFGLLHDGTKHDLRTSLKEKQIEGKRTYTATHRLKRPGDHIFYLEPAPYWEPAEQKMIIHYTKVVVEAFGAEEGWDAMVGLPVEIEPLTRPYGLWTGNSFRGVVHKNGKPVPHAEIEVEYWNRDGSVEAPAGPFITQVIKADKDGEFVYTMPKAGWWSFAALVDGDEQMKNPDGEMVDVELGGLIWVKCVDMTPPRSKLRSLRSLR